MKFRFLKWVFLFSFLTCKTVLVAQTVPPNFSSALFKGGWTDVEGFRFDSTGQMYVYEKGGKVWVVDTNGVKLTNPLINISEEVGNWRDHGLNGFVLDPNFRNNGFVYLLYTVDRHYLMNYGTANYNASTNEYFNATIVRVTRFTADASTNFTSIIPNSRFVLIGENKKTGIPLLHESHSGGQLVFGTDGSLMVTTGDGSSYNVADGGSSSDTYYIQGLTDSIIRPKENVGAFRSQIIDCLNGKLLRIDPATGDGIPSNPYYDSSNPRSAKSRVWSLGLRNPFRMAIRPGTGSTDISAGDPGVFNIGDVGWTTIEELDVNTHSGMNFGWPLFEGLTAQPLYKVLTTVNQDALNPLYSNGSCSNQYFQFNQLCIQDTNTSSPSFPNPCDLNQQIPSTIFTFKHSRPAIDYQHNLTQARTGTWNGTSAAEIDLNNPASPVKGPMFSGYASCAGVWYTGKKFPVIYQNTYFHADYAQSWIRNFKFDNDNILDSVKDFGANLGPIVFIEYNPKDEQLYYVKYPFDIYKLSYNLSVNNPPIAIASQNVNYGFKPLSVQFTGSNSSDPENLTLIYKWNFGDGSPIDNSPNPSHIFNPITNNPIAYTVSLMVTDNIGQTSTKTLVVYLNDTPPQVTITSFANGSQFTMSNYTLLPLQANVFDAESADNLLSYSWTTFLHHNTHTHPEAPDTNRITSTTLTPVGCDGNTYYYSMELTVTDPIGLSTIVDGSLFPTCDPPVADFSANKVAGCSGSQINFTDQSSNLPDSWQWTFVGGSPSNSTLKNPIVVYNNPGLYDVVLTSTNTRGNGTTSKTGYVTIYANPSPVISSSGSTQFCQGGILVLSTPSANSYTWSTGATTQNISVNSSGNYQVTVTDVNTCLGKSALFNVQATNGTSPAVPGKITSSTGNTKACPGDTLVYSIAPVSTATSYTWLPPLGSSIINGNSTTRITIAYGTGFIKFDSLKVSANNLCGSSLQSKLRINRNLPLVPSAITGTFINLCGMNNVAFSVVNIPNTTFYWKLPTVAFNTQGLFTNAIMTNFPSTYFSGSIYVTTGNGCGKSASQSMTLKSIPSTVDSIYGATVVCAGSIDNLYSITADPAILNYKWVGPSGSRISDGSTTSTVNSLVTTSNTVHFKFGSIPTGSTISVKKNNICGAGIAKTINLIACNLRLASNTLLNNVELFPNPTDGSFIINFHSSIADNIDLNITDVTGRNVFHESFTSFIGNNEHVVDLSSVDAGIYFLKVKIESEWQVIRVIKEK